MTDYEAKIVVQFAKHYMKRILLSIAKQGILYSLFSPGKPLKTGQEHKQELKLL